MCAAVSSSASATAQSRSAPPPIPSALSARSERLFTEADEEMRRLTVDIDRVLSGKPGLRLVQPLAEIDPFAHDAPVLWRRESVDMPSGSQAEAVAGWLDRARHARRFERARSAVAWIVALAAVVAISGLAAIFAVGGPAVSRYAAVVLQAIGW